MGAEAGKRSSRRKTRTAPVRATGGRVTVLAEAAVRSSAGKWAPDMPGSLAA